MSLDQLLENALENEAAIRQLISEGQRLQYDSTLAELLSIKRFVGNISAIQNVVALAVAAGADVNAVIGVSGETAASFLFKHAFCTAEEVAIGLAVLNALVAAGANLAIGDVLTQSCWPREDAENDFYAAAIPIVVANAPTAATVVFAGKVPAMHYLQTGRCIAKAAALIRTVGVAGTGASADDLFRALVSVGHFSAQEEATVRYLFETLLASLPNAAELINYQEDNNYRSMLFCAINAGFSADFVAELIRLGSDLTLTSILHRTPFLFAVSKRADRAVLEALKNGGANINARQSDGKSALDIAREASDDDLVQVLTSLGAQ
jgi:hypothetical protein